DDQQLRTRFLPQKLCRRMTDRGAEPGIVLERDAADSLFDLVRILFAEILHDVKFDVSPAFARKSVDRIKIADRFKRFAHQDKAFFFDLDYPTARVSVWLQRVSRYRPR